MYKYQDHAFQNFSVRLIGLTSTSSPMHQTITLLKFDSIYSAQFKVICSMGTFPFKNGLAQCHITELSAMMEMFCIDAVQYSMLSTHVASEHLKCAQGN